MRAQRGRKKKLIVAFHFQFSNPAAWKCEDCRRQGLQAKRRCGRIAGANETAAKVVWAKRGASTTECPKSLISAQSIAWLEAFYAGKRLGFSDVREMSAREAEAMLVLEQELLNEVSRAQQ